MNLETKTIFRNSRMKYVLKRKETKISKEGKIYIPIVKDEKSI